MTSEQIMRMLTMISMTPKAYRSRYDLLQHVPSRKPIVEAGRSLRFGGSGHRYIPGITEPRASDRKEAKESNAALAGRTMADVSSALGDLLGLFGFAIWPLELGAQGLSLSSYVGLLRDGWLQHTLVDETE